MKDRLPRLHERLSRLRETNPERFDRAFRKLMPFFHEYRGLMDQERPELAETVMEEFQAEDHLRELSRDYQAAKDDPAQQSALAVEIDRLVRKQVESREKRFLSRLDEFEERIQDQQLRLQMMKDQLQSMRVRKEDLVNRRVTQIKNGRMAEGMPGFGPMPGGPRPDHEPPPGRGGLHPGHRPPPPGEPLDGEPSPPIDDEQPNDE